MSGFHIPGLDPVFNEIKKIPDGSLFVKIICVVIGLALLGICTTITVHTLVKPIYGLVASLMSRWHGVPQIHTPPPILDLIAWLIALGIVAGLATAAFYYLNALQRRVNNIREVVGEHGGLFKDILALIQQNNADFQKVTADLLALSKMGSEHLRELSQMGAEHLRDSTKDVLGLIQHLQNAMAAQQEQIRLLKEGINLLNNELAIVGERKN